MLEMITSVAFIWRSRISAPRKVVLAEQELHEAIGAVFLAKQVRIVS